MSEKTTISYADHTWSPWLGCEPVSPGCAHCYASAISKRAGRGAYRHGIQRTLTKDWEKPKRWNKRAIGQERVLVSMCDTFDPDIDQLWIESFLGLMSDTPNLTWLALTKRPEIAKGKLGDWTPLPNVWLGVSVENQEMADERIPILLSIPARVRWVSIEPMLGPVDLRDWTKDVCCRLSNPHKFGCDGPGCNGTSLKWAVIGGESGFNHRKLEIEWVSSVADQCKSAGVACYVKQDSDRFPGRQGRIPNDLWAIKQFPKI